MARWVIILALGACRTPPLPAIHATTHPVIPDPLDHLIDDLTSDDIEIRDRAEARLRDVRASEAPRLEDGARSSDLETAGRCARILRGNLDELKAEQASEHYRLAERYYQSGDFERAELECAKALRLQPGLAAAEALGSEIEFVLAVHRPRWAVRAAPARKPVFFH